MKKILFIALLLSSIAGFSQSDLSIPYSVRVKVNRPTDAWFYNKSFVRYTSTAQVLSEVGPLVRYDLQRFNVNGIEYVFKGGIADANLQVYIPGIPDQTGHSGQFLTTDGTNLSWIAGGGGSYSSSNGINLSAGNFILGGPLTSNTSIPGAGFTWTQTGLSVHTLGTSNGGVTTTELRNGSGYSLTNVDANSSDNASIHLYTGGFSGSTAVDITSNNGFLVTTSGDVNVSGGVSGGSNSASSVVIRNYLLNVSKLFTAKQRFTVNSTNAGINLGTFAGDPSSPVDGDVWVNTTIPSLRARVGGSTVSLGSGGGGSYTASSPITLTGSAFGINDAVANGTGKGAASFGANDFNSSAGNITLDYTNGQTGNGSHNGYLSSFDWNNIYGSYTLPVVSGLNIKIVSDGNSNSVGYQLPAGQDYPTQVYDLLGGSSAGYSIVNVGISGQTTQQMQADAVSQVDALYNGAKTRNFLFAWEMENDVFVNSISGATAATNMLNYWNGRKTAGFYVIGATSPMRGNDVVTNNALKTANTAVLAGTSNYNAIVDIPSLPILSNVRGSGFQDDNVHFSFSGVTSLRDAYASKVRTSLSQTDYTPSNFMSWNGNTPDRQMIVGPLNSNALSFISGGKIRAEVTTDGTLTAVADVDARAGSAIGFYANPGLTATANNDVLSVATFKPAYYDNKSFTGVLNDVVQIKDILGNTPFRAGYDGKLYFNHTYTATNTSDGSISIGGTKNGFATASSTFSDVAYQPIFNFGGDNTNYVAFSIAPTINRLSYSNTRSTILKVSSGAAAISADKALFIEAPEGTGIDFAHSGTGTGINLVSNSTGTSMNLMNTTAGGLAVNMAKFDGNSKIGYIQNVTSSYPSALTTVFEYARPNVNLSPGAGMSFSYTLGSSNGTNRFASKDDLLWTVSTNTSESSARVFSIMKAGTLSEAVRFEEDKVSIGSGTAPKALLDIKPSLGITNGGQIILRGNKITSTSASGTGSLVSIVYATQPSPPFEVGSSITISGVTPSGYNGTYTVVACTTTIVQFAGSTTGSQTVAGTIVPTTITGQPGLIQSPSNDHLLFTNNAGTYVAEQIAGSFSGAASATTTFTVTIGGTQPDVLYKVAVTPTAALTAAPFYVTNKTTTTFDVTYLVGLTGTATFDWILSY
jgi:hypothetical protein